MVSTAKRSGSMTAVKLTHRARFAPDCRDTCEPPMLSWREDRQGSRRGWFVTSVDKRIARLNIEHFRQRLTEEHDEVKRKTLLDLLAKEEEKLRKIEEAEKGKESGQQ